MPAKPFDVGGVPGKPVFASQGKRKYYNPFNVKGEQFNQPAVKQSLTDIANSHARSQYFRRAGFGAALRYTLGMEQVPSHEADWINSRQRRQTGLLPGDINAMLHHEPDEL